jgi:hypothetical protein
MHSHHTAKMMLGGDACSVRQHMSSSNILLKLQGRMACTHTPKVAVAGQAVASRKASSKKSSSAAAVA